MRERVGVFMNIWIGFWIVRRGIGDLRDLYFTVFLFVFYVRSIGRKNGVCAMAYRI